MMRLLRGLVERLLVLVRRNRFESDLDDELRFHFEELTRRNFERGMSLEEAKIAARRNLGRDDVTKEKVRKETGVHAMLSRLDAWGLDLKLGFRMLLKYPGLTLAGGLAMAVGIAISLGFASMIYSLDRTPTSLAGVVTVQTLNLATGQEQYGAPVRDFVRWRDELGSVENLTAFLDFRQRGLITEDGRGDPVNSAEITPSAFRLFRVPPLLGRPLVEEDAFEGALPVVVIGYDVWRTRFGSDPHIVGRGVRLGSSVSTVVGVMPEGFAYPVKHGLWTPLRTDLMGYEGDGPRVEIFGRLGAGVSLDAAQAELTGIGLLEPTAVTDTRDNLRLGLVDYASRHMGGEIPPFVVHMFEAFFALLLLVPFANVAILVYARTARRQGEIAVRNALGATRVRIVTQLFVEALVLAASAAAGALLLIRVVFGQLNAYWADSAFPFWFSFSVSSSAVWYLVGLTVLAATVVGIVPAVQATGSRVHLGLRTVGGGAGIQLGRLWTALIVGQVAITVAILPFAVGVAWRSIGLGFAGPGLATEDILTARLVTGYEEALPDSDVREDYRRDLRARLGTLWNDLKSSLEAEPRVSDVTFAGTVPGALPGQPYDFEAEGETPAPDSTSNLGFPNPYIQVDLDYFNFFEIPLLAGRLFGPEDRNPESRTVIVDRNFVQAVLDGMNPVGRRIRGVRKGDMEPEPWREIVGVVDNFALNESSMFQFSGSVYSAELPASLGLALRVGSAPATFSGRLREIVTAVDPAMGVSLLRPLSDVYRSRADSVGGRFLAWTLTLVILSLLFLSTAGIYALTSFAVTQRRREIAIRVALGAQSHRILRNIFSRAAMQLAFGAALGTMAAVPLVRYFGSINLPVVKGLLGALDVPGALMAVVAFVMAVGLAGSLGPASRGLSVQAVQVLKEE
jgi:predicted permease